MPTEFSHYQSRVSVFCCPFRSSFLLFLSLFSLSLIPPFLLPIREPPVFRAELHTIRDRIMWVLKSRPAPNYLPNPRQDTNTPTHLHTTLLATDYRSTCLGSGARETAEASRALIMESYWLLLDGFLSIFCECKWPARYLHAYLGRFSWRRSYAATRDRRLH